MPTIQQHLTVVKEHDKKFSGTIALRNEKLTLPDGSKVAIGIDSERWVVLYQRTPSAPFIMYEYNADNHMLLVDKVQGTDKEYKILSGIIDYFFSHADVSDVVTIEVKRRG